ncbi:MAG: hypothetical protein Kow0090_20090 [Myxococcota bacterium]
MKKLLYNSLIVAAQLIIALLVACSHFSIKPPLYYDAEEGEDIYFGRIMVKLFSEEASESSRYTIKTGEGEQIVISGQKSGLALFPIKAGNKAAIKEIRIAKRDVSIIAPVHIPLGNRYYEDEKRKVRCFGEITLFIVPFQEGEKRQAEAVGSQESAVLPPGVTLGGELVCSNALKELLIVGDDAIKSELTSRIPEYWKEADPLYGASPPGRVLPLPANIFPPRFLRPYSYVEIELGGGERIKGVLLSATDAELAMLEESGDKLRYISIGEIKSVALAAGEGEGLSEASPKEIGDEKEIAAYISAQKCGESGEFQKGAVTKPYPSLRHTVAVCSDGKAVSDFYFKVKTDRGKLWRSCASGFECEGDECVGGLCIRKCKDISDCGGKEEDAVCLEELCYLRCNSDDDCPGDELECAEDSRGKMCLPKLKDASPPKPVLPAK